MKLSDGQIAPTPTRETSMQSEQKAVDAWPEFRAKYENIPFDELARRLHVLEREVEQWTKWGVIEIAVRNPNVASWMDHWEGRATVAERSLSRMRDVLEQTVGVVEAMRAENRLHGHITDASAKWLHHVEPLARSALAPARAEGTGDAAPAAPDSGEAMSITLWADGAMAIKAAWVHSLIKQGYSPGRAGELVNERLSDYAEQS